MVLKSTFRVLKAETVSPQVSILTNALVSIFTVRLLGCGMWAKAETHLRQPAGPDVKCPPTKMLSPTAGTKKKKSHFDDTTNPFLTYFLFF